MQDEGMDLLMSQRHHASPCLSRRKAWLTKNAGFVLEAHDQQKKSKEDTPNTYYQRKQMCTLALAESADSHSARSAYTTFA